MSAKEQKEYSLTRMINAQMSGNYANAGFEKEVSDENQQKSQKLQEDFLYLRKFGKEIYQLGLTQQVDF